VDLFGKANLEWQGGSLISGVGGAPDFVRAAKRSHGGRASPALPSAARRGLVSRIVPRLTTPCVSLARADADLVVTENGVADLLGLSHEGRAQALIDIADLGFRETLRGQWRKLHINL
jgi:acyl-CoA hydrolase